VIDLDEGKDLERGIERRKGRVRENLVKNMTFHDLQSYNAPTLVSKETDDAL